MATEDALDALSVLQNIAPLSYDSSRLLDVACIGFGGVQDPDLATLRSICRLPILSHVQVSTSSSALVLARQVLNLREQHATHPSLAATKMGPGSAPRGLVGPLVTKRIGSQDARVFAWFVADNAG